MRELTEQDIDYISVGASVLGSGGGGDPKVGRLLAKSMIQKYGPVNLISIDELQDDQIRRSRIWNGSANRIIGETAF